MGKASAFVRQTSAHSDSTKSQADEGNNNSKDDKDNKDGSINDRAVVDDGSKGSELGCDLIVLSEYPYPACLSGREVTFAAPRKIDEVDCDAEAEFAAA